MAMTIEKHLQAIGKEKYKNFMLKLVPNLDKDKVIGVNATQLRAVKNKFFKDNEERERFFMDLPHNSFEENNIHAFLLNDIKDCNLFIEKLKLFLPYLDNWATTDYINPKNVVDKERLKENIYPLFEHENEYAVRLTIKIILSLYIKDNYDIDDFIKIANIKRDEYYIKMAKAWALATLLIERKKDGKRVLDNVKDESLIKKTMQKYRESNRT